MHFAKVRSFCLFLMVLSSLLVSTSAFAADKREFQPKGVYSQNQEEDNEPTVENMLKAKQAGDFEKAARIQAILNEKAKKFWRSPGGDERSDLQMTSRSEHNFSTSSFCQLL